MDKIRLEYDTYVSKEKLESEYYRSVKYNQNLIKDIICYNAFEFFNSKFIKKTNEIYSESLRLQRKQLKYTFAEEFLRVVIVILCIAYTASQVMVGRITIGGLSVTFGLIINLVYSMQRITKNLATIYTHTADIAQFYEFMDMEEEAKDSPKVKPEKSDYNTILKNVSYAYPFSDAHVIKK